MFKMASNRKRIIPSHSETTNKAIKLDMYWYQEGLMFGLAVANASILYLCNGNKVYYKQVS